MDSSNGVMASEADTGSCSLEETQGHPGTGCQVDSDSLAEMLSDVLSRKRTRKQPNS